ncbi:hypothetical protein [Bacillus sp. V3-13]|uniref:hypothetical protein n=1 Tax=Bacillus sp. V3-13 TaxID=2053728 RepID=UPI0015E0B49E|nr:hypothetical protein [Bacillus sp. V3-13]
MDANKQRLFRKLFKLRVRQARLMEIEGPVSPKFIELSKRIDHLLHKYLNNNN